MNMETMLKPAGRLALPQHLTGLSVQEMRALSPLPENAQKLVDTAVVKVGLERLSVVADLMAEGLTYNLPNPLSVTEVQWESVNKIGDAIRTMSPEARGEFQLPDRSINRVPVYLTMDDFSVNIRTLLASQRVGQPLDTFMVEEATRRVNEAIEDAAINGAGIQQNGYTTPGLLTASVSTAYTYETSGGSTTAWTHSSKTGQKIVNDVLAMIDLMQAAHRYGPYNLYVNTTYGNALNKNFSDGTTTFPTTILQRLEQIQVGGRNLRVRVADRLPTDRTVLVQMTSDVIDVIDGQRPTVVPWTSPSGFTLFWAVMAIVIPRIRKDYDSNKGIVTGNV
jgi:hypothetical protein